MSATKMFIFEGFHPDKSRRSHGPRFYLSIVGRYGFGPRRLFAGLTFGEAIETACHLAKVTPNPEGAVISTVCGRFSATLPRTSR